jgi:predicted DNA-binding transcriptional regulator YafY
VRTDTQGQWARVIWLDAQIRSRRYPNVQALLDEFGVRRRTAFNTIAYLRDSLGAPLRQARRGYYYEDPTYHLPAIFLQEGELLALLLAQQVTHQYLGTPLEAPLREAVRKISRYLPEEVMVQLEDVADAFQFAGGSTVEVPLQWMTEVHQAVRERRVMRILYYTASRDETGERDIEPHFLRNVRGDWTVVAWDRWRGEVREFMLARMRDCRALEEQFIPRPEFDRESYARHTFLTDHGAEPYEIALRFDSYQARWIRECTWHPSQRLEEQPGGELILRLTVAGEGDLMRWILGYGSHVEVLEPDWLRERLAVEVRRTSRRYGPQE